MDRNNPYYPQVQLLVQLLPLVFQETLSGAKVVRSYKQKPDALRLIVTHRNASIKIELSPVLRGTVYPPVDRAVVEPVEHEFGFAEVPVLAHEDLYAGKICAALDRQHPRDLFDVMLLLENEGINNTLRKTVLIYLLSHQRPVHELLAPRWQTLQATFDSDFRGMTFRSVKVEQLIQAGRQLLTGLLSQMTDAERRFLCSIYDTAPDWNALDLQHVQDLPAVRWKMMNIAKMSNEKRVHARDLLHQVLASAVRDRAE